MSKHDPRYQAALDKAAVTIRNEVDQEVMTMKLEALNKMLLALLGNEALVTMWWDGQNRAFDYKTPREVYETTPTRVINYITGHYQR